MAIDMSSVADGFEHTDIETVVVYVDIAGFTAFVEAHGDHRAAELAETFASLADTVLGSGDAMIKAVGDAVTIASDSPAAALASLRQLHDVTRRIEGFRCYVPASVRVPW